MGWNKNYEVGSFWEERVKEFLISQGYHVRKYECFDGYYNELAQYYTYIDGTEDNPHPDFILTLNENKRYVEVKSKRRYTYSGKDRMLGIESFHFESYLKLALWKKVQCDVIFTVFGGADAWYSDEVRRMNKTKQTLEHFPDSYFWNIKDLKRIK